MSHFWLSSSLSASGAVRSAASGAGDSLVPSCDPASVCVKTAACVWSEPAAGPNIVEAAPLPCLGQQQVPALYLPRCPGQRPARPVILLPPLLLPRPESASHFHSSTADHMSIACILKPVLLVCRRCSLGHLHICAPITSAEITPRFAWLGGCIVLIIHIA